MVALTANSGTKLRATAYRAAHKKTGEREQTDERGNQKRRGGNQRNQKPGGGGAKPGLPYTAARRREAYERRTKAWAPRGTQRDTTRTTRARRTRNSKDTRRTTHSTHSPPREPTRPPQATANTTRRVSQSLDSQESESCKFESQLIRFSSVLIENPILKGSARFQRNDIREFEGRV